MTPAATARGRRRRRRPADSGPPTVRGRGRRRRSPRGAARRDRQPRPPSRCTSGPPDRRVDGSAWAPDRQRAPPAQLGQERPLGFDHPAHGGIVDGGQSGARWNRRRPDTRRPAHPGPPGAASSPGRGSRRQPPGRLPRQPVHGGPGGHHRGDSRAAPPSPAGWPGSPAGRRRSGPVAGWPAAPGAGPIRWPPWPRWPGRRGGAHQHVTGVAPLGEGGQHQPGNGQFIGGGQILGRVDGGVGIAPDHRRLDLLDEHALAARAGRAGRRCADPLRCRRSPARPPTPAAASSSATRRPATGQRRPTGGQPQAAGRRWSCRAPGHRSEVEQGAAALRPGAPPAGCRRPP